MTAPPRIAITCGEPAGIGPDVTLAAATHHWEAQLVAIGDAALLAERAALLGLDVTLSPYDPTQPATSHTPGQLAVLNLPLATPSIPGKLDSANAPYVVKTLNRAVDGCRSGEFAAMVTAPVQKSIINEAGIPFSGHTELLAERTHTPKVVMMLVADTLRVALATTHLPLRAVADAITPELLAETLSILDRDLKAKFAIPQPRIAVLGLNPHAGEGGHLGREELDTIIPTLDKLRAEGLNLSGPHPADTAFNPKLLAASDAVFAMFHDQGLPVLKYAGFGNAINLTLGLPIIRTSVDHGTALDLAGSGKADSGSMQAALALAIQLATNASPVYSPPAPT